MDEDQQQQCGAFFDERMTHPKATAIDAPKHIEFDWELLRRLLGEAKDELSEKDYESLGLVLREIMSWLVRGDDLNIIGRRAVALGWVVNPKLFDDDPSARQLAKKCGVHYAMLSEDAASASRKFNVRNRSQKHGWNFKGK